MNERGPLSGGPRALEGAGSCAAPAADSLGYSVALMRQTFVLLAMLAAAAATLAIGGSAAFAGGGQVELNVLLRSDATPSVPAKLGSYGKVREVLSEIDAVVMQAPSDSVPAIKALSFVKAANPDAERSAAPVDTVPATDFVNGLNTWDLDAVNVTNFGAGRTTAF